MNSTNSLQTRGQMLLASEMLRKASDMRISHRKRAALLRYAWEVLQLVSTDYEKDVILIERMLQSMSEYESHRWTHTEIKRVCREVRESLDDITRDRFPEKSDTEMMIDRLAEGDIPF